ncbi:dihydrodipicolinate synthase family protein [Pseudomonas cremoricolorata]|uniref:Dihydrodipicolinate synthase n=1 Tax=Pseudomonas cremoricolorata TaxID=157783 RepID=A0A089WNH3_9PSED|nr:dihydrodipicolinate synthase family protein [Pseudomonas cremoricolorata]AIR90860.1 dihydrodipicolinate synthase [Pseudomonas cremoricolorata]
MSSAPIRGVIGYTITPFTAHGALDLEALGRSIERMIDAGVHAIAPLGSTGEGAYLNDSEWEQVVRYSLATIAGRVPTVVSVSDLTTARTVQRARLAAECGATAVMVLPVSYWKLTDAEIVQHYKAIGAAIDIPIMLYNNPGTSGTDLSVEVILRILAEVDNVTMVKESTGDIQRMHRLHTASAGRVAFYNGCNPLTLEALVAGASGWCTAAPNLIPALNLALWQAVQDGALEQARSLFYQQYALLDYITRRGLPSTVKAGLAMTGLVVGAPRLPLQVLEAPEQAHLRRLLSALDVELLAEAKD